MKAIRNIPNNFLFQTKTEVIYGQTSVLIEVDLKKKGVIAMMLNTILNQSVQYKVWSESQCEAVVDSAFRILERTGCQIQNEEAIQLLKEAGCVVEKDIVKIPYGLIQWAVDRAPKTVTIYDRNGEPAMKLSKNNVHFGPAITCTQIVDFETGERRAGTKADAANVAKLIDALPNISWASGLISISDAKNETADIAEIHTILKNTRKPIMYWAHNVKNLACEFEMFEAVAGGADAFRAKPFAINLICPMDPLVHTDNGLEQVMYMAKKSSPAVYIAGIGFGLSGPITLAGSIALGLADTLVGLVVSQLTNPGTPFIVSKFNDNIDMKTILLAQSRPELIIAQSATADVFRYLELPFCSNFGNTDSGTFDELSTFDKSIQLYSAILSGTNMSFAIGSYEAGNLAKLEDFVLCNEMIEFMKVLTDGIVISEENLAEETIDEVGPGGNFIASEHTIDHLHDFYEPDLMVPFSFKQFEQSDRSGLEGRIKARVKEILDRGIKNQLPLKTINALDEIMNSADGHLN